MSRHGDQADVPVALANRLLVGPDGQETGVLSTCTGVGLDGDLRGIHSKSTKKRATSIIPGDDPQDADVARRQNP